MGWSFGIFTIFSKLTKGINSLCEDDPESEEVKAIVRDHIENNLIAIFSNAYCSFCQKARRLAIDELDVVPAMLDIEVKGMCPIVQKLALSHEIFAVSLFYARWSFPSPPFPKP